MARKKSIFQNQYVKWGAIGLGALVGFKILGSVTKVVNTIASPITGGLNNLDNKVIQNQTGLTPTEIALCQEVAEKCNNAIYGNWGYDPFEDESEVIKQLKRLFDTNYPHEAAKVTSSKYREFKGKSLKADVQKYLDSGERLQIDSVILSNLT